MYYKDLKEALLLEMTCKNKKVIVSVIYHSPSQNNSEFDLFLPNFGKLLSDISKREPSLFVITGDFNAGSSSWWPKDINTTVGSKLFSPTSSSVFPRLINELTHIQISKSSCIDLIFTDQRKVSVNSGVRLSLHPNCHHQIVHSSFKMYSTKYIFRMKDLKVTSLVSKT